MAAPRPTVSVVSDGTSQADPGTRRLSLWTLGGLGVVELARRVWTEANEDEVFDRAASLSYYFVFALFPALLVVTSLIGLLPSPDITNRLMSYVVDVMPADAASVIQKAVGDVVAGARGSILSIGALGALWAASGGVVGIMTALSVAYDVDDRRPWWKRRLIAIALTFALAIILLSGALLMVFGGTISSFLAGTIGLGGLVIGVWNIVQWPLAAAFILFGIALVYYAAPALEHRQWRWFTPGSLLATVGWLATSIGLRAYVSYFSNYRATYGSIAGMILLLLWLYLGGLMLLLGAEVDAEIEHAATGSRRARTTADQAPRPAREATPER